MDINFEEVNTKYEWMRALEKGYLESFKLRHKNISVRGFPIITRELLDDLIDVLKDKTVIDIGCGAGYLSYHLKDNGINIRAIDKDIEDNEYDFKKNCFTDSIEKVNYLRLDSYNYDVFIISWPNYQETDIELLLDLIPKDSLIIYQGENYGGCCGTDEFFEKLDEKFIECDEINRMLNKYHLQFEGIHDYWKCYKKF